MSEARVEMYISHSEPLFLNIGNPLSNAVEGIEGTEYVDKSISEL